MNTFTPLSLLSSTGALEPFWQDNKNNALDFLFAFKRLDIILLWRGCAVCTGLFCSYLHKILCMIGSLQQKYPYRYRTGILAKEHSTVLLLFFPAFHNLKAVLND